MKKIKIFFLVLVVIILGFSSYLVYELKLKKYDTDDEVVSSIIEKGIEINLPNGQVIEVDQNGEIIGGVSIEAPSISTNIPISEEIEKNSQSKISINEASPSSGNTKELKEINEIKAKYKQTFLSLENEARNRLNSVVEHAKSEYATKKSNGEKISYGYFYRKYSTAAKELESTTDQAFEIVLTLLEEELERNGYDRSYANSYITEYKKTKETLRKSILNKAISF